MLAEQTVRHTEYYMAKGIPTTSSMKEEWACDPLEVGFPSNSNRVLPLKPDYVEFKNKWSPERNCVYE